jgi:glycosyltransferase involved in cell wall biosynthesis
MVSVVIPAYNEEKCIEKCLDALVKQETTIKFEVIVVNNTSTDRTQELVKKYVRKLDLKLLDEKKKGRGSARHAGFQAASGNIIFSTDADTIVPIDWIEKIMGKFKKDTDAVSGTCKIVDCGKFTNLFFNAFQPLAMKGYRIVMGHYWLSGFHLINRAVLINI